MKKINFYHSKFHVHTGFALLVLFILCYTIPNQLEWISPSAVPEVFIDRIIPFQPHWVWIYLFTYVYVVLTYFFVLDKSSAKIFVNTFVLASLLGGVVFFFFPTTIFRELYPLNPNTDLSSLMLYYMRSIDKPKNCIPSFHIALTFATTASLYLHSGKKRILGIVFGVLIAYSTMAVKQHYFLDVFSGMALGSSMFFIVYFSTQKEESSSLGINPVA